MSAFEYVKSMKMKLEPRVLDMLRQIGINRGQNVLDFGCGYGTYTIPVAEIVGEQGRVYALDKDTEALDALMQRGESAGLKNIYRLETSGELETGLSDESVDVVLLYDVFHSFYFPREIDRKKLLCEIHRIMKSSAFLSISVCPNLIVPDAKDEIKDTDFRLEKEIYWTPEYDKELEICGFLNFRKV